jgi:peptidoglycan/LPS O-acetylase OafA/YrhL
MPNHPAAGTAPATSGPSLDPVADGRYPELDALRGVAAFVVVAFHCWMTVAWPEHHLAQALRQGLASAADPMVWFKLTPLRIITAGPAAVGLFFTLSGFVLSLPWARGRPQRYAEFLVKRVCRLYLPFAAAIGFAAIAAAVSDTTPIASLSAWFNASWTEPVSWPLLVSHLAMKGTQAAMSLDNVMWSLVHEARISLVFPLLVIAMIAVPIRTIATSGVVFAVLSLPALSGWTKTELAGPGELWGAATLFDTLRYGIYFVAGILLALHLRPVLRMFLALGSIPRLACWLLAIALLLSPLGTYSDVPWALGAVLLIALAMSSTRARALLGRRPLRWLGRVSYSLYLVHVPILLAIVHFGSGTIGRGWLLTASLVSALIAAELFNRAVEGPSQRLGRLIAAHYVRPRTASDSSVAQAPVFSVHESVPHE